MLSTAPATRAPPWKLCRINCSGTRQVEYTSAAVLLEEGTLAGLVEKLSTGLVWLSSFIIITFSVASLIFAQVLNNCFFSEHLMATPVKWNRNFAMQLITFWKTPKASFQIYKNQSGCECNLLVKCHC